jgi:tetratricopeptide (TPR) repeat protein
LDKWRKFAICKGDLLMRICPRCRMQLKQFEDLLVCPNADYVVKVDEFESRVQSDKDIGSYINTNWCDELCLENNYWNKSVFMDYPSIIAHEYYKVFELLNRRQTYGAFLQLKDLLEVLMKFPILCMVAYVYNSKNRTSLENQILMEILKKPLSLGDWENIARKLLRMPIHNESLYYILKNTLSLYEKNNITNWRNNYIGHGATGSDVSDSFKDDIKHKLKIIKDYFTKNDNMFKMIKFVLVCNNNEMILQGKDRAKDLEYQTGSLCISSDGIKVNLSPFIVLRDKNIYFFDSYLLRKQKTAILNYPFGFKNSIGNREFLEVYENLKKVLNIEFSEASVEDSTFLSHEEEMLEKMLSLDDFQSPKYLVTWLNEQLEKKDKGTILLQMENGMGKTTFIRALDEKALNSISLGESTIRCYYINDVYTYKVDNFVSEINSKFQFVKENIRIKGKVPTITRSSPTKKEEFANMLNFYAQQYNNFIGNRKLLFIIDGVDEIKGSDGDSIFDFIPEEEMLSEGVYILITCRTNEEIVHYTSEKIKSLQIKTQKSYYKNSEENITLLNKYINKNVNTHYTKELLELVDYKFLYLKLVKELINDDLPGDKLNFKGEIINYYFSKMEHIYGSKFYNEFIEILCIISVSRPLTFSQLSYLLGESRPSFRLLNYLLDLRSFLKIDRSYRGNLISIQHKEIRDEIIKANTSLIKKKVSNWVDELIQTECENIDFDNEGLIYQFSFILDNKDFFSFEDYNRIFSVDFCDKLDFIAKKLNGDMKEHIRERLSSVYSQILLIKHKLLSNGKLKDINEILESQINKGVSVANLLEFHEAIGEYTSAIELCAKYKKEGLNVNLRCAAKALIHRAYAYNYIEMDDEAIKDYEDALAILKDNEDEELLLYLYVYRSGLYWRLYRFDESLEDANTAISIADMRQSLGKEISFEDLAWAYNCKFCVYSHRGEYEEAFENIKKVIEIREKLSSQGKLKDENELALTMLNLAGLYGNTQKPEDAKKYIDKCIKIQYRLLNESRLKDENFVVKSIEARCTFNVNNHNYKLALQDINECIRLQEKLIDGGKLLCEGQLADLFRHRASIYLKINSKAEALEDYNRAISLREDLIKKTGYIYEKQDLAFSYQERCIIWEKIGNLESAFKDIENAFIIFEYLLKENKIRNFDSYILCLLQKGDLYLKNKELDKAGVDYKKAIELCEELYNSKRLSHIETYISAASSLGVYLEMKREYDEAFKQYTDSVKRYEETKKEDRVNEEVFELLNNAHNLWINGLVLKDISAVKGIINILRMRSFAYMFKGDMQEQKKDLEEILALYNDEQKYLEKDECLAETLCNLGQIVFQEGKILSAINYYKDALKIYEDKGLNVSDSKNNDIFICSIFSNLADAYCGLNSYDKAIYYYNNAISIAEKSQNSFDIFLSKLYQKRANAYAEKKDKVNAIDDMERVLLLLQKDKNKAINKGEVYIQYAEICEEFYEFDKALNELNAFIDLTKITDISKENNHDYLFRAFELKAEIHAKQGLWQDLLEDYNSLINLKKNSFSKDDNAEAYIASMLINRALPYIKLNNLESARIDIEEAVRICRCAKDYQILGTALFNLGTVYADLKLYDEALKSYKESLNLCKGYGANGNKNLLQTINSHIERCNKSIAMLQSETIVNKSLEDKLPRKNIDYARFKIDLGSKKVTECHIGEKPYESWYNAKKKSYKVKFNESKCLICDYISDCPVIKRDNKGFVVFSEKKYLEHLSKET